MDKRHAGVIMAAVVLMASPVRASGFAFYEQGAKASGQAGAWVARADDASANWYNPAALVNLTGVEIQFGANYLDIGSDTSFTSALGATSGTTFDAISSVETPAQFYFSQKVSERFAWGVGINNPFGLVTEWDDFPLTLSSRRAELVTFLLNVNFAFRLHKYWSFGAGADYLSAEVKDFSRDTVIVLPGPTPTPTTANLTGTGDGFGYNAALQFKRDHISVAAQYRSGMSPEIEGTLEFSGLPGTFLNSSASAKVELPSQAMIGAAYTSKRFDVEADAYYTAWNVFKSLEIQTPNPATSATLIENWSATWSYRLGLAFRLGKDLQHEIRAGGVWDESPVPTEYLRPSIPDSDRTGYSLGYGWQGRHIGVDVYGMQIDFDDATANGLLADGVIPGTYESSILLLGGTFKYRF